MRNFLSGFLFKLAVVVFILLWLMSGAVWGEVLGTLGIPFAVLLFPIGIISFPLVGWLVLGEPYCLLGYVFMGAIVILGVLSDSLSNAAFRQVHKGGRGVIQPAAIASAGAVGLRAAEPEAAPREPEPSKLERTREVSDLMWRLNDYKTITCDCGTKLKVPAKLKRSTVKCPHCGRTHPI